MEQSEDTVAKRGFRTQMPIRLTDAEWNFLSSRCICSSPDSFLSVFVREASYNYIGKLIVMENPKCTIGTKWQTFAYSESIP